MTAGKRRTDREYVPWSEELALCSTMSRADEYFTLI
jgi:hypothetical protein